MALISQETCSRPDCSIALDEAMGERVPCPGCDNILSPADGSLRDAHMYCSKECLILDKTNHAAECERRSRDKGAVRCGLVVYDSIQSANRLLFAFNITGSQLDLSGIFDMFAEHIGQPQSGPRFPQDMPDWRKEQAYNFERCVVAVLMLTPFLLYFQRGKDKLYPQEAVIDNTRRSQDRDQRGLGYTEERVSYAAPGTS
jgi:hypothetical protein